MSIVYQKPHPLIYIFLSLPFQVFSLINLAIIIHQPMTTNLVVTLTPYTNHFLSAKKKYKPIAKKVRPVIGELAKKFRIERKIIGNPLNDLPTLNPKPPPFIPSDRYTLERRDQLDKNHPGNFLWPAEEPDA
jgi:hypothetical protein